MKVGILFFALYLLNGAGETSAQVISTSNRPSQLYSSTGKRQVSGPSVYGVFAGRTPCQELLKELNMGENKACAKRKMGITLYHDSITHTPTTFQTRGMGKWSGKGKWHIVNSTPDDSRAIVFQLHLGPGTFLYLLKGDDNVLFILDKNKNFLPGNESFSYTLNRVKN
jgi:hypothetical protein